jgi:DNA-binding CsgD family transcriptional regulator
MDPIPSELLERDDCLRNLDTWFQGVETAGGRIALVSGEAGVGKTSLVRQFAQQSAATVLWGACDALFTPHPLAPVRDIARQTGGALMQNFAADAPREIIFSSLLDELEREKVPRVVIFEDVHWADDATLDVLKYLGRRIERTRVMLVVTYRSEAVDMRHPLRFLLGDLPRGAVRRIEVPPLTESGVTALAQRVGRDPGGLYTTTGGNAFFVTEALATAEGAVPTSVRDAVLARLSPLSTAARELFELLSVVPGKLQPSLLDRIGSPGEDVINECQLAGMVRDGEGLLSFRHELARRALEDSLSPTRRRLLHSCVLAALLVSDDLLHPEAQFIHHAEGAGDKAAVIRFAPAAAEHAAKLGSHRESAAHCRTALQYVADLEPTAHAELLERLSYECYLTDQGDEAIRARTAALAIWKSLAATRRAGDTLRWLSRLHWFVGHAIEAESFAHEAIGTLEPLGPGRELAMAYSNLAQLHMLAGSTDLAISGAKRAIDLATQIGDDEIRCHALNNLGTALIEGSKGPGWPELEESLRLALVNNFQEHTARAYTNLTTSALSRRSYDLGRRWLNSALEYYAQRDLDAWDSYLRAWRARMRFEQGDWNGATEDAETVLRRPGVAAVSRIPALIVLGRVRTRRGDPSAREALEEARALAVPTREAQRISPVAAGLAERAWVCGDAKEAAREAIWGLEVVPGARNPWVKGELVYWLWRSGESSSKIKPEALAAAAEIADPYSKQITGHPLQAAKIWAALGCPYEEALALSESDDADAQRSALAIFERLEAAPQAGTLRKRLRAQGVRDLPRVARRSTRANPAGLTNREVEILGFLILGMRNSAIAARLFLASKTVDHHLSAIFTKLAVSSRGEAVVRARELGIEPAKSRVSAGKR